MNGKWLFRGQVRYGKGWLYGSLLECGGRCEIFVDAGEGLMARFKAKPETVGLYSGLDDKDGNRCFADDIVLYSGKRYAVRYTEGAFFIEPPKGDGFMPRLLRDIGYEELSVIGNVHDSPELLRETPQAGILES